MKEIIHGDFKCDMCKEKMSETRVNFLDLPGFYLFLCKECSDLNKKPEEPKKNV